MTEKARKIFDILGVEPMEEFRVVKDGMLCRFDEELTLQCKIGERHWDGVENINVYCGILNGDCKILKVPKPTEEDEIVIAYAKLCGCKYIAKDKGGSVCAYEDRPVKGATHWCQVNDDAILIELICDVSFLSWEDEEPYYIGE